MDKKDTCPHHWLIPPPDGPTAIGTCKWCGATKEFSNVIETSKPIPLVALGVIRAGTHTSDYL